MKKYIITILGKDRPGIIAAVTQALFEREFNIEEVRQTILQGEFSGNFIVQGPDIPHSEDLKLSILAATRFMELNCHIKPLETASSSSSTGDVEHYIISTRGPDCKGLVAQVASILANFNVNVTQLQAIFRGGNEPLDNVMVYEVDVPRAVDIGILRGELRERARHLNLEISFQHQRIFEAINRI